MEDGAEYGIQVQHLCFLSSEHLAVAPQFSSTLETMSAATAKRFPSQRLSSGASPARALSMGHTPLSPNSKASHTNLLEIAEKIDHALTALNILGCRATQVGIVYRLLGC